MARAARAARPAPAAWGVSKKTCGTAAKKMKLSGRSKAKKGRRRRSKSVNKKPVRKYRAEGPPTPPTVRGRQPSSVLILFQYMSNPANYKEYYGFSFHGGTGLHYQLQHFISEGLKDFATNKGTHVFNKGDFYGVPTELKDEIQIFLDAQASEGLLTHSQEGPYLRCTETVKGANTRFLAVTHIPFLD